MVSIYATFTNHIIQLFNHCIICFWNTVFIVKRIIFLFSGSDETHRNKHALTFLLDNMIKEFSESKYIFDFEGSDSDGLARFYKGFGGKEVFYPEVKYNNLKGIFKIASKIMGK